MFYLNSEVPDLIDDPTHGLMPFLRTRLTNSGMWDTFKIRPWLFDGVKEGESAFAFGEFTTEDKGDDTEVLLEVILGYMLTVEGVNETQAKKNALFMGLEIDKAVRNWVCKVPMEINCLGTIPGNLPALQNPQVSTENPNAWYVFVMRRCFLNFYVEGHNNG